MEREQSIRRHSSHKIASDGDNKSDNNHDDAHDDHDYDYIPSSAHCCHNRPNLWERNNQAEDALVTTAAQYDDLWQKYAKPCPHPQNLLFYMAQNLVVVQEIALTVHFLLRHQISLYEQTQHQQRRQRLGQWSDAAAAILLVLTLMLVIVLNSSLLSLSSSSSSQSHSYDSLQNKARQRFTDGCLIGILLRLLSSLLQSLTASYADDAVQTLALFGLSLHVLTADYDYANGQPRHHQHHFHGDQHHQPQQHGHGRRRRPPFLGGTLSLNAAFFATILLLSRLHHSSQDNTFVTSSTAAATTTTTIVNIQCWMAVVFFAIFPSTRHELAVRYPPTKSPVMALVTFLLCTSTGMLCPCVVVEVESVRREQLQLPFCYYFMGTILLVLVLIPMWKYHLQFHKVSLQGPWDIPLAESLLVEPSSIIQE